MKTKSYMFIVLLFIFSSCTNWLDVQLDNKVDDSKLFSSAEGFKEALAGVYSRCLSETCTDAHSPWNMWTFWPSITMPVIIHINIGMNTIMNTHLPKA